jgi:hypothetical protein
MNLDRAWGTLVDLLFIVDIFVNFFAAYEVPGSNTFEVRPSVLAKEYLLSWFWVDLIASIPVDLLTIFLKAVSGETDDNLKYYKLSRLPRLYRVIKIIRIFKILKLSKYNSKFSRVLSKFKLSAGSNRIVKFLSLAIFMVHIIACVWFLQARF